METRGIVLMRGERGPGIEVEVLADQSRLSLVSGSGLIGDWEVGSFGIKSLYDGFAIWAEGEEFVLRTENDVGLARELGMQTASPRMARRVAASRRKKDLPWPDPIPVAPRSYLSAIALAVGGVLVIAGSLLLRGDPALTERSVASGLSAAGHYWSAFAGGGLSVLVSASLLAIRARGARALAIVSVVALVIVFGNAAQRSAPGPDFLIAYGFIAGGAVIGLAVLFGGFLGEAD
ncbi:MAG TPA: hypothetical protein VK990_05645 [Acidimicrobiia bacterium]|nr:hypothetical protein [Acidimicrobiia bacterium]